MVQTFEIQGRIRCGPVQLEVEVYAQTAFTNAAGERFDVE